MRLDSYLRDFERSLGNLPLVLERWSSVEPDLRDHYCEELALMLARAPEALEAATLIGRAVEVGARLGAAIQTLASLSSLNPELGLSEADFAPPNTSCESVNPYIRELLGSEQLPLAA